MEVVMKNIFIILVISLTATGAFLSTKVVAAFPEVGKPEDMVMDHYRIYITERENIYIYSRDNYKLKTKFGKRGEGPQEFMLVPHFQLALGIKTDKIAVYSMGKISHFRNDGVFMSETKLKSTRAYDIRTFGDFFLGAVQAPGKDHMYNSAVLYDAGLNKVKVLKRVESQFKGQGKGTHILENQLVFRAHGDKIFISDCDPFVIDVFDKKGNNNRCYIFNTDAGKFIKEIDIPLHFKSNMVEPYPFSFWENTFFQLVDNPETKNGNYMLLPSEYEYGNGAY
jgi:hypothetical protein